MNSVTRHKPKNKLLVHSNTALKIRNIHTIILLERILQKKSIAEERNEEGGNVLATMHLKEIYQEYNQRNKTTCTLLKTTELTKSHSKCPTLKSSDD